MKVLYAEDTKELELSGTGQELRDLAACLRSSRGILPLDTGGDPSPYDKALSLIEFECTSGHVVISHVSARDALRIQGGADELDVFASSVEEFGNEGDPSAHIHVEHVPGHEYLAPSTEPLVIALLD
ncbi:hypothetical protein GCM10027259_06890 [Micromonospora palomenae]|uniref:Imm32 family immunity protein n=1 Tax=Micromonospora palomenae TaxID=1461247 RepID=UPI0012B7A8DE|nr:hypothetical protein [Micromonospora palomenae]